MSPAACVLGGGLRLTLCLQILFVCSRVTAGPLAPVPGDVMGGAVLVSPETTKHVPTSPETTSHVPELPNTTSHVPLSPATTNHVHVSPETTSHVPASPETTGHEPEPPGNSSVGPETTSNLPGSLDAASHVPVSPYSTSHAPLSTNPTSHVPLSLDTTSHASDTTSHVLVSPVSTSHVPVSPEITSHERLSPVTTSNVPVSPDPTSPVETSPASMPYPCGDGHCQCGEYIADCSKHGLDYIPRLPHTIQKLDMSGNKLVPTDDLFSNASGIWHMRLAETGITHISRRMLQGMIHLTSLVLNDNPWVTLDTLRNVLSMPSLQVLSAENCHLPPPPADAFKGTNSNVAMLTLNSNTGDGKYDLSGMCHLEQLENLYLLRCSVKHLTSSCSLKNLKNLDLSHNAINNFPTTCIGNTSISMFPTLKYLTLAYNLIDFVSESSVCLPRLSYLDISFNMISELPTGTFSSLKFPQLRRLLLNYQRSQTDIYLVYATTMMESNVFDNPNLEELRMGSALLPFEASHGIEIDAFAHCSSLRRLTLEGNDFSHVDEDRFIQLFGNLSTLTELLLANSRFQIVSRRVFTKFPLLAAIDLSDNSITHIPDGTFDSLNNLNTLLLHNNKIAIVREQTFDPALLERLTEFSLEDNPYSCTCDLKWFRDWLVFGSSLTIREQLYSSDYKCNNVPGLKLEDFDMPEQACLLTREVSVAIILFVCFVVVSTTVSSLLFQFRWHLRLLLYEAFRGRADVRRQRLATGHFTYDIFVSYASEDLGWVRQHLMAQLEEGQGLRLCVHERDFIPGKNIVDNIVDCVGASKKILMVFSRSFVLSQWCQFELAFCLNHVMTNDDMLIVVCVDDVASRAVTSAMMAVFKTTTYIQFSEGRDAQASFWGRLRVALQDITQQDEGWV